MHLKSVWKCIPARYILCAMCFIGIVLQFTVEVAMSVAIVAMVRHPSRNGTNSLSRTIARGVVINVTHKELDICPGGNDDFKMHPENGEFDWDEKTQGHILAAYFFGHVATQIFGGRISEIFGSKVVIGPGVLLTGMLSLLSPVAARLDVAALIILRVLIGAASGVIIPSTQAIIAKWYPSDERTSIGGVIMAAIPIGVIISLSLSGVLAEVGGWPLIFYFFGTFTVFWFIPWILLVYDSPEEHPYISDEEKSSILNGRGIQNETKKCLPVPWISILTSVPVWANIIMGMGCIWVGITLLTELPTYLTNILHFNLRKSGLISSLPFIFVTISELSFCFLSQWLQTKGYVSRLKAYHIFNGINSIGVAVFIFIITMVGCDSTSIMILLILSMTAAGSFSGGSMMNYLDLSSNFAGTLSGLSHTFTNMSGVLSPILTGFIINGQQTLSQWNIVFYISIAIKIVAFLVFLVFGSTETQPWNNPPIEENKPDESV